MEKNPKISLSTLYVLVAQISVTIAMTEPAADAAIFADSIRAAVWSGIGRPASSDGFEISVQGQILVLVSETCSSFCLLIRFFQGVLHISAVCPLSINNNLCPELKARSDVLIFCSTKCASVSLTSVHKWQDSFFSLRVVLSRSPAVTDWFIVNLQRKNHS